MKIVILYPKLEPFKDYHYMPFSALCVASAFEAKKYKVAIIDERIEANVHEKLIAELKDANCLSISTYSGYQLSRAYELASYVKTKMPGMFINWGGPHIDANPYNTLASGLVDRISKGYAEQGENLINWDLIDIHKYINPSTERFIYVSSYGCVGRCTFCATKNKRPWVELPIKKVSKDIDNLMAKYKFKECVFFDATIFTRMVRVLKITDIMRKHDLVWIADARADEIVKIPKLLLDSIINSKLKRLTIGLETGSKKIVGLMNKGKYHLEKYEECARRLSGYENLVMCSGVIFGCPGESIAELKETIAYIKRIKSINKNFFISTTFFMPLPDTIMADNAKHYGYKEPQTLEEWAVKGAEGHYKYNQWMDNPWIADKAAYKKIYDEFINECNYLV